MKKVLSWIASLVAAIVGIFAVKRHVERLAVLREKRELNRAVKAIEKQLAKQDSILDAQARAKIETIRNATREILKKTGSTGADANALIEKVKGK